MVFYKKINAILVATNILIALFCISLYASDSMPESFTKYFSLQKKVLIDEHVYQISHLTDMKIGRSSEIYILDRMRYLVKFNEDGSNLKVIAGPGGGPGELGLIKNFDFDSKNNIVLVDSSKSAIQVLDRNGKFIKQYRLTLFPSEIYIGKNDQIYIGLHTYKGECKFGKYLGEGKPYKCLMKESGKGKISENFYISELYAAIDEKGNLYAADPMEYKIHVFDPSGRKLYEFGQPNNSYEPYSPPPSTGARSPLYKAWAEKTCVLLKVFILDKRFVGVAWGRNIFGKISNFIMDIYTLEGKKVATVGLPKELRLAAVDDEGGLYFIKNEISNDGVDVKTWYYRYIPSLNSPIKSGCKGDEPVKVQRMTIKKETAQRMTRAYLWEMKRGIIYIRPFPTEFRKQDSLPGWAIFGQMMW